MVQARFAGFTFEIAETATLFDDLKFSGECAVEENTSGTAQYVSRKNGKAGQVSFTAILNAALGADVRKAALEFEAAARYGQTGTLVVGEEVRRRRSMSQRIFSWVRGMLILMAARQASEAAISSRSTRSAGVDARRTTTTSVPSGRSPRSARIGAAPTPAPTSSSRSDLRASGANVP